MKGETEEGAIGSGSGVPRLDVFDAVLFDLDGVVTRTADVHAAAWKTLFDEVLRRRAGGDAFVPFDASDDYRRYVDGKPRYDGVRSFLASRGIELPYGRPTDEPGAETVCGLGNRKNGVFLERLRQGEIPVFESTVRLIRQLKRGGVKVAVVSSSENCSAILEAAGLSDLFEVQVDGVVAQELGLPGKPDPTMFLEAARQLGVQASQAVVVEDAVVGVEAGRRGGFGLVVGVDRTGDAETLREHGADVVVDDLVAWADA